MEASDDNGNAGLQKGAGDVYGPGKLVGLNSYKGDHSQVSVLPNSPGYLPDREYGAVLVMEVGDDVDIFAQDFPLGTVEREAVEAGEGVGDTERPPPLDDITVFIVVGGFNKLNKELLFFSLKTVFHELP